MTTLERIQQNYQAGDSTATLLPLIIAYLDEITQRLRALERKANRP